MATRHFRSTIAAICAGSYTNVVWHWTITVTGTPSPFQVAKGLRNAIANVAGTSPIALAFADCLAADCFISSIRVQEVGVPGAAAAVTLFPSDTYAGQMSENVDANQVAGCVIWLTAANAGVNGRSFMPGVSEDSYEGGRPSTAYKTALGALVDELLAGLTPGGDPATFVLKHGTAPFTFTPIVHGYLSPDAGTMRKRLTPY